jgi:hypothetical protein
MKLPTILFGLLLALCVVLALTFVIDEVPFVDVPTDTGGVQRVTTGHGTAHGQFSSMDHGGAGAERHQPILWLGWVFGLLQITFVVACLALGVRRRDRIRVPLVVCGLLLASIFTMIVVTYQGYVTDAAPALFGGLPAPTAWFFYGFWPAQGLVVVLFVVVFSRLVVTGQDMERFREILAARRAGDR